MTMLNYYNGGVETQIVELYSFTYLVNADYIVRGGIDLLPHIRIECVSHDSVTPCISYIENESFIIRYGEVLYAITETSSVDDGYENTVVHLMSEPTSIEDYFSCEILDYDHYEYETHCIPFWMFQCAMNNETTRSIGASAMFHYSEFI